jgi:hypothetical protein
MKLNKVFISALIGLTGFVSAAGANTYCDGQYTGDFNNLRSARINFRGAGDEIAGHFVMMDDGSSYVGKGTCRIVSHWPKLAEVTFKLDNGNGGVIIRGYIFPSSRFGKVFTGTQDGTLLRFIFAQD